MAIGDAYATAADYRAVVSKSDTGEDAEILSDLKAISRYIDLRTGRFFGKDAAVVARVYTVPDGRGAPWVDPFYRTPWNTPIGGVPLEVDDIASVTGLLIRADTNQDGTFPGPDWAATDYVLEPANAALGPEPMPYTRVLLPSWSTQSGLSGGQRVRITAVWGWPAVPDAIVRATCHLTGILRLESPRATSRVNELGEQMSTSKQAQDIVQSLVRVYRRSAVVFA